MLNLEPRLDSDLKKALLSGDTRTVDTLRGIKSAILYAKVAAGTRDRSIPEELALSILHKEAKKRQESADLYLRGGSQDKAAAELAEKAIIERYMPAQLDESKIRALVDDAIQSLNASGLDALGAVIAKVKSESAGRADGALIAKLARERLNQ